MPGKPTQANSSHSLAGASEWMHGAFLLWFLAAIVPMSHTCFQVPQMAWKLHVFNIWSNGSLSYRIQGPLTPHGFFLPFLFLSGFTFNNQACTCCSDRPSLFLLAMHVEYSSLLSFLSSPAHAEGTLTPLWATDPQETLQEEPGLQACTSDPSWGPDTLNFSSMPSASHVGRKDSCKPETLDC